MRLTYRSSDSRRAPGREALIVVHAEGPDEVITFEELAADSSRFAHHLVSQGIQPGQRVAIMLEPSRAFYVAMFGVIKSGAIAVPLFTLFGPDGIRLRVNDCQPALLVTNDEKQEVARSIVGDAGVLVFNTDFLSSIQHLPSTFEVKTRADDLAVFQYTSGTTRELPDAVKHSHRALVTLMVAALYLRSHSDAHRLGWLAWAGAALFTLSMGVLRACHQLADLPWSPELLGETLAQASLTVAWCIAGVTAWVLGSRRGDRALWWLGAGLLGVVLLKLLVVDRQFVGNIAGIVSFVVVGLLLIVVGRIAPTPPRSE